MHPKFLVLTILLSLSVYSQEINKQNKKILENHSGHVITDPIEKSKFLKKLDQELELNSHQRATQSAVHLCSNSNFEEFENVAGVNVLKNFLYTTQNPLNPTQCATPSVPADQYITQYNPSATTLMAGTVPSNHFDEFIGDINAFDQFALKINYKDSYSTSAVVQAKRFKTNNETSVVFNYKVALQSIPESGHDNEQPFFKARILNKNGMLVKEFCLIGDPQNCIFTQDPGGNMGSIILYTKNWQSGTLDISSIPNNEEFTIEFTAARCGLNGHFGYAYVDDLCVLHSDENLQGSIELNPLYKICPELPLEVCGKFTIPNSGGISANVNSIQLNVYDSNNAVVYTTTTTKSLDLINKTFCFELAAANFPNITNANYNIGAIINYGVTGTTNCIGTNFSNAFDNDANPGSDISFLNCNTNCDLILNTGILKSCDSNGDGQEIFDLTNVESQLVTNSTGLTFSYFTNLNDATNDTNPIATQSSHQSYSSTIFVRVTKDANCYKIISIQLIVKNPRASISGILNVCNGSTTLTASPGVSYLWSNGGTSQTTTVTTTGTYIVNVTDAEGCQSEARVTIIPTNVATSPEIEIIQPTCFLFTGTIKVTSPAAEYSFDDGATWTTSNTLNNVNPGTYKIKIRTVNNCYSYSTTVAINSFLSSFPLFTSTNPTSCETKGSITITTTAAEYSFDDGVTWTTNNTKNNLTFGIYKIRIKDAQGCISNFNNVTLYGEFMTTPTYISQSPYCSTLGSIVITSPGAEFSLDGGNVWQTSNIFTNLTSGSYVIKVRDSQGCTSQNLYVYLVDFRYLTPNYTIDPAGCNKYATITITDLADYYSFDGGATWTTSNSLTGLSGGENIIMRLKMNNNCFSYNSYAFINSNFLPLPTVTDFDTLICDNANNGQESVNLNSFNSNFVTNSANFTFSFYTTLTGAQTLNATDLISNNTTYNLNVINKTLYVVVKDVNGCTNIATLNLELIATPIPSLKDINYLCENFTVELAENKHFDSYLWSTGERTPKIIVDKDGIYTLTVTEIHGAVTCTTTKSTNVILSNPAIIKSFDTNDWTHIDNIISVNVNGLGDYEYSLDGFNYQDSNIFSNLPIGEYTVYVRDKHGCGVTNDDIYLLKHPKYFTPNDDGLNDFWKIKFSHNEPNLIVKIFDRFGKFICQIDSNHVGWDGKFNGKPVIADDYWFVVTRQNGKQHKGHFTLKR